MSVYYVLRALNGYVFVKEESLFLEQRGHVESWGRAWWPVTARSVEEARQMGAQPKPNPEPQPYRVLFDTRYDRVLFHTF